MEVFKSKKFVALCVFFALQVLIMFFGATLGVEVSDDQLWQMSMAVAAYLAGQGIADIGKEKSKIEKDSQCLKQ